MHLLIAAQIAGQSAGPAGPPSSVPVTLQPDVSLTLILLVALFNPAVMMTALWLGRSIGRRGWGSDKILLAGFIAAAAGIAFVWCAAYLRFPWASSVGRAAAGLFAISILTGALWAALGRRLFK